MATVFPDDPPLRGEIEARNADLLPLATDRATYTIASLHGKGPVSGGIRAHVVVAAR